MWIGKRFKKHVFNCPDGTKWNVGKKISEKEIESDGMLYERDEDTSEAQAVYKCKQVQGPSIGKRAILKVRMQIPEDEYPSPDPKIRGEEASNIFGIGMSQEMFALDWLTKTKCSVSPRLIYSAVSTQDGDDFPVPGGWMVFLLMEKVPGVPLTEFRDYDSAKREKIREAFRRSLTELYSHHATPFDYNLANLIYDEKQDKCYFVDFEDVWIDPEGKPEKFLNELEFKVWGLDDESLGLVKSTDQVADQLEQLELAETTAS